MHLPAVVSVNVVELCPPKDQAAANIRFRRSGLVLRMGLGRGARVGRGGDQLCHALDLRPLPVKASWPPVGVRSPGRATVESRKCRA